VLDVLEKPFENLDVAMHTDVNIVSIGRICQVLLEVFHVPYENVFLTTKVFAHFPVLVENMNSYMVAKIALLVALSSLRIWIIMEAAERACALRVHWGSVVL
jgi:hypothetical protein